MRFILGLIVGAALTVAGAFVHDTMDPGAAKPLVNWTNAAELQKATFEYVKVQAENLIKWATGKREG
jgi:hypothetical protein